MANSSSGSGGSSSYDSLYLLGGGLVIGAGLTYLFMCKRSSSGGKRKASNSGRRNVTNVIASSCSGNGKKGKARKDANHSCASHVTVQRDSSRQQEQHGVTHITGSAAAKGVIGTSAAVCKGTTEADAGEQQQHSQTHSSIAERLPQLPVELFHFRPIGYLRSCFTTRNGTPRQPLLVTSARSRLVLLPDVPEACFEGLSAWSHVWVLYVFHDNTEPRKVKRPLGDLHHVKGKVKVPRLNGEKIGLFATRTPHRPVPIGLSVAQVIEVGRRHILLGGADIVDGSPVLDIKPYVPFCDSVPQAMAPAYVKAEADEEPLAVAGVQITSVGQQQLTKCWAANSTRSLYDSAAAYINFVSQVLSRDIRSLRQRLDVGPAAQQRNAASLASAAAIIQRPAPQAAADSTSGTPDIADAAAQIPQLTATTATGATGSHQPVTEHAETVNSSSGVNSDGSTGVFHVVLEGIDVFYDVAPDGLIIIGGASLDTALAREHAHKHHH